MYDAIVLRIYDHDIYTYYDAVTAYNLTNHAPYDLYYV